MELTPDQLLMRIQVALRELPSHLRAWAERHLVTPREVYFWSDPDRRASIKLWLLTDHIGADDDGSCRIVFDPSANAFGIEQTLADGTEWYMGPQEGTFADAVRGL
jgi:hypothetical protein